MNIRLLCLLSLCLVLLLNGSKGHTEILVGGVEHRQTVEPLPEGLRPGEQYSQAKNDGDWYLVPRWLVGRWASVHCYQLREVDERTGTENSTSRVVPVSDAETFGMQMDASSEIWTASTTLHKTSEKPIRIDSTENRFVSGNDEVVRLRTFDTSIDFDSNKDDLIASVVRVENIRRIHQLADGVAAAYCDIREYSDKGLPTRTSKQVRLMKKVEGFRPINSLDDRDIKAAFTEFLRKTGRASLIPRKT